ncbi:MAG TPA: tRNA (adenosine(37)-N6)-dimethylallyltransferase MiaA [Gemmatimonadaceae bacterium]
MGERSVPVILGPTAAGKSALAMRLGAEFPLTIVSADSRQVYRGFDVGTAKPTAADQALVPHEGIDVADPAERFSAFRWADLAHERIEAALRAGRQPVVVGGTGFYVRALFETGFAEPPMDPDRRLALQQWLGTLSLAELRRWCAALDPARAPLGRAQLLRAIEVALLAGERLSDLHRRERRPARWRPRYLVVDPGASLGARIARRAAAMLDQGWPEEVRGLLDRVPDDAPAWNAAGYAAVRAFVRGEATRPATLERVTVETRQYAKRQRTWFRHQLGEAPVLRVNPDDPAAWDVVRQWWTSEDGRRA